LHISVRGFDKESASQGWALALTLLLISMITSSPCLVRRRAGDGDELRNAFVHFAEVLSPRSELVTELSFEVESIDDLLDPRRRLLSACRVIK
jgi:hypothetical protein